MKISAGSIWPVVGVPQRCVCRYCGTEREGQRPKCRSCGAPHVATGFAANATFINDPHYIDYQEVGKPARLLLVRQN